jgi:hypothetical protein
LRESVPRTRPWPLEVRRELREPDAKRVQMTGVRALVFKHCVDLSLIKLSRKMRRKRNPWPQEADGRGAEIALVAKQ